MVKKVLKWLEVSVAVAPGDIEHVVSVMDRYGYGGAVTEEEHDKSDRKTFVVKAYLPCDRSLSRKRKELEEELKGVISTGSHLKFRFTEPEEWFNGWKKFFKALDVGERLVIKPSWENYSSPAGKAVIEIDPGMAFGTGHHATTRLCLISLEKRVLPGMKVLDIGTGTGILAIAAAKLGASSVLALDADPVAVSVARENMGLNGVASVVQVKRGTINQRVQKGLKRRFDFVVANITSDVIADFSSRIAAVLKPGGKLIAGGINDEGLAKVKKSLSEAGFSVDETQGDEDWYVVIASLKGQ